MTTTVKDNPAEQRYEIRVDGVVAGYSAYDLDGDRITFTHTEVDDAYAGQGLGKQLVIGLLDDVDSRRLDLVPLCQYVRKVIASNADRYLHLVPEDVRDRLGLT